MNIYDFDEKNYNKELMKIIYKKFLGNTRNILNLIIIYNESYESDRSSGNPYAQLIKKNLLSNRTSMYFLIIK